MMNYKKLVNKMKPIDEQYFLNYGNTGKPYSEVWKQFTRYEYFLEKIEELPHPLKNILFLGSATGETLVDAKKLGHSVVGIEKNEWALEHTPKDLVVFSGDMKNVVKNLHFKGMRFDVAFSNSLAYLSERDLKQFLIDLGEISEYLFYCVSSTDWNFIDEYREINQPYSWWVEEIKKAGWEMHSAPYLWRKK